jgi:hypothetical protein
VSPVTRPGRPLRAQLVPQRVGNRATTLMQVVDLCLEGFEKLGVSAQHRRAMHQLSLLGDRSTGGKDCAPEQLQGLPSARNPAKEPRRRVAQVLTRDNLPTESRRLRMQASSAPEAPLSPPGVSPRLVSTAGGSEA